jgi:excisionase family DNA binding protein
MGTRVANKQDRDSQRDFVTIREAAQLTRLSESSIRRFLTTKKLRRYKVAGGSRTLCKKDEVLALIQLA